MMLRKNIISHFAKSRKHSEKNKNSAGETERPQRKTAPLPDENSKGAVQRFASFAQERLLVERDQGGFLAGELFLEHLEDGFGLDHAGAPHHFA